MTAAADPERCDCAIRCVYLAHGATLSGFTLTNGATRTDSGPWTFAESGGGGVLCESEAAVVSNCVIIANSAVYGGGAFQGTLDNCTLTANSARNGGGVYGGYALGEFFATLNNCTLTGNTASEWGGGAWNGTLNNCVLTGNSASLWGGGALGDFGHILLNNCTLTSNSANSGGGVEVGDYGEAWLNNCIIYHNTAGEGANYSRYFWGAFDYCCTTPLPVAEPEQGAFVGNITNAPLFVDEAGGNLRLQSNSPCINGGNNAYAPGTVDMDGQSRIVSGTVDVGAYEFQGPGSMISYAWLQHYGLPTDGSADATDPDADRHNTWQEWRCLTDPTNALSVLHLLSASHDGIPQGGMILTWESVAGVNYFLESSTNLGATPCFTPLATNLLGQPGTTTYTDTNAVGVGPFFYRVGAEH
ncbi:MAG: right-handed parallel beta-helix repeat-containing protein [Verrucomicrobia bacterium]|nr:right-handed parallel beta-helix repeat-containing protein [Verrucomicrobiota bacterium]